MGGGCLGERGGGRGASTPSQVLGVNIYCLLVSFVRFAHAAVWKLAGVCCASVLSGGSAMLLLFWDYFYFFGWRGKRVVWEKRGGVQVRKG